MMAALHGELDPFPLTHPEVGDRDAYILFHNRSSAMTWLVESLPGASPGLWSMNDADQDSEADIRRGATRRLWFQVHLEGAIEDDRPLPLQPFLSCIGDVAARLGTLDLHAVQILVPLHSRIATGRPQAERHPVGALIDAAGWFGDTDPRLARRIQVTLDTGQDPAMVPAAPHIPPWIRRWKQAVFRCDPATHQDDAADALSPKLPDHLWRGPGHHRTTLEGTLCEWSVDAVGWLAALAAEAAWQNGVRTPLMLTVRAL
ncbi:hypothetical protein LP52_23275 [Streptomonospora alba]|uniref:Uncharacterized protein n=2 Tax=Streptomonospora alba TaxID=183763 RepID=A0A0C2FC61_9ACTN|nr:hypothetical protein LP52_23275 [Streptomonospora alba]